MASNHRNETGPAIASKSAGQRQQPPKASSDKAGFLTPGGAGLQASQMHNAGQTPDIRSTASRARLPLLNTKVPPAPGTARGTPESALQPQSGITQPIGSATGPQAGQRPPTPARRTGGNEKKQRPRQFAGVSSLAAPVMDIPARSTTENGFTKPSQSHRG